jgi:hypothetical protein
MNQERTNATSPSLFSLLNADSDRLVLAEALVLESQAKQA